MNAYTPLKLQHTAGLRPVDKGNTCGCVGKYGPYCSGFINLRKWEDLQHMQESGVLVSCCWAEGLGAGMCPSHKPWKLSPI